jgi:hypothetical protein
MIKLAATALAAAFACATAASAAEPVSAVHVPLDGKTVSEVRAAVLSASEKVCEDADFFCVQESYSNAMLQYRHKHGASDGALARSRDGAMRVASNQKSPAESSN